MVPDGANRSFADAVGEQITQTEFSDIKVNDARGNQISDPVFIFLGHEMIHAHHNQRGRNRRGLAATDGAYSNREEQETVATGALNENQLRAEHGLTARHGSGGVDTRSP